MNIELKWDTVGRLGVSISIILIVIILWCVSLICIDKEIVRYVVKYIGILVLVIGSMLGIFYVLCRIWD